MTAPRGQGFAVASFVLGVCALIWAMIAVGGLFGLAGLACGIVHLRRSEQNRALARWGVRLSAIGLVGSLVATGFYLWLFSGAGSGVRSRITSGAAWDAWAGVPAPALTVRTLDGKELALDDLKGRPVLLNFWATWCGPCRKETPHLDRLARETDVAVVAVSQEAAQTVRRYAEAHGLGYTFAVGRRLDLPEPYRRVRTIPTSFFIDRNGVIREVLVGALDYGTLRARATAPDHAGTPRPVPTPPAGADEPDEDDQEG